MARVTVPIQEMGRRLEATTVVIWLPAMSLGDIVPDCWPSNHFDLGYRHQAATVERFGQEQAFIWEASDPYLYIRTTADGRVICGGEDEEFADEERRDALIGEKSRRIVARLGLPIATARHTTGVRLDWIVRERLAPAFRLSVEFRDIPASSP